MIGTNGTNGRTKAKYCLPRRDTRTLTTGDIARAVNVSPRTVSAWIDSGALKGHRLPGGEDRRVYREDAVAFFISRGMIIPPEWDTPRLLYVGPPMPDIDPLAEALSLEAVICTDGFQAGVAAARLGRASRVALVSLSLGRAEMLGAARLLRVSCRVPVVLIVSEDEAGCEALAAEFHAVVRTPFSRAELAASLAGALS